MASSRVVSRLIAPSTLSRLSTIGSKSVPVRNFWHHHHRKCLPEAYASSLPNAFQRWEKEFERMQEQFGNYFQDIKNNRSPGRNFSENDMIITESDGSKKFHLSINISGFEPEEIKIKTQNGALTISAKKEKKVSNDTYSLREFSQTYSLPEELKIDDLKSTYTENGILAIEAPLPTKDPPKSHQIKIERVK